MNILYRSGWIIIHVAQIYDYTNSSNAVGYYAADSVRTVIDDNMGCPDMNEIQSLFLLKRISFFQY